MTKVLITGGAGFVGSSLAERLLAQEYEVHVIDDLSTGSLANITRARRSPHFHYYVDTVTNTQLLEEVVSKVDVIYHLAASVGVKLIVDKLIDSIKNNVWGTETVLEAAYKYRKKVLLTSTSEVYGRSNTEPFRETDDLRMGPTIKSRWSYACSKALDEYLGLAYFLERQLPVIVVRLFNTVGERQTDAYGMVVPTFVKQALAGQPLTIYGTGQQSRCFCHVQDVVEALQALMENEASIGEVYNIGSTEEITIDALADRVIALTGSSSKKQYIPYAEAYKVGFDDIQRRVPNIDKVHALTGFTPRLTIDDIIRRVQAEMLQTPQTDLAEKSPAVHAQ